MVFPTAVELVKVSVRVVTAEAEVNLFWTILGEGPAGTSDVLEILIGCVLANQAVPVSPTDSEIC